MSDHEAITCARQDITPDDLADYDDQRLAEAYRTVLAADQPAIDAAVR
ncbi:hypothetical protein AB0878_36860 [Amycolatopsis sp. NPDC047767]